MKDSYSLDEILDDIEFFDDNPPLTLSLQVTIQVKDFRIGANFSQAAQATISRIDSTDCVPTIRLLEKPRKQPTRNPSSSSSQSNHHPYNII